MLRWLPLVLLGCADVGAVEARRAWLVDALVDDNRIWLSRDPALLRTKYDRMEDDVYDFMRGTAGVFFRDLARPGTNRTVTSFLVEPAAWSVLIAGDPHPENLGTFVPSAVAGGDDTTVLLEIDDLDGAAYGPYLLDVRRGLVSLALLLEEGDCDSVCREPVLGAYARAYADELTDAAFDAELTGELDPAFAGLLLDALDAGDDRDVLDDYTKETDAGRRFRLAPIDTHGDGMLSLTAAEDAQLDRLLAAYDRPAGFRVLDVARRFGTGVASLPAVRYVVAFDRGEPGGDDDGLLTIREVVDAAGLPRFHPQPPGLFADNAARIERSSRALWSRPGADPHLDGISDGAMTFKVQTWSGYHESLDHGDVIDLIDDEELAGPDLLAFAARLGAQLAATHGRAPLAEGGPARPVLQRDLGGREDRFVAERIADAEHDLGRLLVDYDLFREARAELGPWLGAERLESR